MWRDSSNTKRKPHNVTKSLPSNKIRRHEKLFVNWIQKHWYIKMLHMSSVYYTSRHYRAGLYCLPICENTLNQNHLEYKNKWVDGFSETMIHSKKWNSPCETLSNHIKNMFVFIITNKCAINITTVSLYIIYTPTCFGIYIIVREVLHLFLAKLHEYLKLRLLKSQFHKIIKTYVGGVISYPSTVIFLFTLDTSG
jgi:hypothetical protein